MDVKTTGEDEYLETEGGPRFSEQDNHLAPSLSIPGSFPLDKSHLQDLSPHVC